MRGCEEVKKTVSNEFKVKDGEFVDNPTSKQLPYEEDSETGVRTFDITGRTGTFHKTKAGRPGDRILDGSKVFEIQKDGSFKRVDKKRRRK